MIFPRNDRWIQPPDHSGWLWKSMRDACELRVDSTTLIIFDSIEEMDVGFDTDFPIDWFYTAYDMSVILVVLNERIFLCFHGISAIQFGWSDLVWGECFDTTSVRLVTGRVPFLRAQALSGLNVHSERVRQ